MGKIWGKRDRRGAEVNVADSTAPTPAAHHAAPTSPSLPVHAATHSGDQDMTSDLMRLIGGAIDEWSRRHGLTNLPPDIVFEQALLALNEIHRLAKEQSTRKE